MKLEGVSEDPEPSGCLEPIPVLEIYLPLCTFTSVLSSCYVPGPVPSIEMKAIVITIDKQIRKCNVALKVQ